MKLSTALTCVLSTISFTSGSASNPRSLRGYDQSLSGPFDVLKCTFKGRSDEEACSAAVTVDGSPCSYCTMSSDGQEAGLCVDPQIAAQMVEKNEDITCTNIELGALSTELGSTGFDKEDFKCEIEAMNDAEKCATTMTVGEDSCEFCSIEGPFGTQGFCFSPDHAEKLKGAVGDKVTCIPKEKIESSEDVEGPFDVFKCTFKGRSDEEACSSAVTVDGSPCSYCTMSSDGQEEGLCVDPQVATQMTEMNEEVTCTNTMLGGAITGCNTHGAEHDICLDPSKVNGSQCIWCESQFGGFCFPKEWKDTVSKFLNCDERKEIYEVKVDAEDEELKIDPSFFKSNCFQVGLKGGSPDDCRAAVDNETGESCIFCSSERLGGIGLCMTPDFKGNEGRFYTCDNGVSVASE